MISPWNLRPIQSLVASAFFFYKHVFLMLPRQEGKTELGVRLGRQCILPTHETRQSIFLTKSKEAAKKMTREKFSRVFDADDFQVNTEIIVNKNMPTNCMFIDSVDKRPDKLRGGTYHLIVWAEIAFSEFDMGVTVHDVNHKILRPTLRATKGYSFLESTPNGNNGWKEMWEDTEQYPIPDEDKPGTGYKRLVFPLSKLVEMGLRTREEYDALKKVMPDLEFLQEYECAFVSFVGRAYPEFMPHLVWADMPPPQHWQRTFFAIDWGYNPSATCVLFGYVLDGRVCVFDEIYGTELLLDQIQAKIKEKFGQWQLKHVAGVADHDPRSNKELQIQGILVNPVDKLNVYGNRLELKTLMKNNMLYVHPRCEYTIRDLNKAQWDPKKEGEIDYKNCNYGHYDAEAALRYLVRGFKHHEADAPRVLTAPDAASRMEALRRGALSRLS